MRADKAPGSNSESFHRKWVNDIGELRNARGNVPRAFTRSRDGCARDARASAHDRELDARLELEALCILRLGGYYSHVPPMRFSVSVIFRGTDQVVGEGEEIITPRLYTSHSEE